MERETGETSPPGSETRETAYRAEVEEGGLRRQFVVRHGRPLRVGRDPSFDVVLADEHVSWRHAVIEHAGSVLRICDLGSGRGTFVNGVQVEAAVGAVALPERGRVGIPRLPGGPRTRQDVEVAG